MSGNNEAAAIRSIENRNEHLPENAGIARTQLTSDSDLSNPANRLSRLQLASVDSGDHPKGAGNDAAAGGASNPSNQTDTSATDAPAATDTIDEFMAYAPKMYRHRLGLRPDANSHEFIDSYMHAQAEQIEHSPERLKEARLGWAGIEGQTAKDILEHKPGSEKTLENILVQKEREFLEIPASLTGEPLYKKMEDGILRDNYRAQVDMERLSREMQRQ